MFSQFSAFSIFLLSILVAAPLTGHKTPLPSTWVDVRVKHKWNTIPDSWVSLGQPPNDTIIDLYISLKPHRENALVDALYEVSHPRHPKHVLFSTPLLAAYSPVPFFIADMAPICQWNKLPSLLRLVPTRSSL